MSRIIQVCFLVILLTLGITLWAQQRTGKTLGKPAGKEKKSGSFLLVPHTYLGNAYSGGPIQKATFDELLRKGFSAHDSVGNKYKIAGFDFTYAERNLYEDSVGNLEVLVDFLSEYCVGDTITSGMSQTLYQRIKPGDTVYIDHVKLLPYPGNTMLSAGDTAALAGKGMKCVIIK